MKEKYLELLKKQYSDLGLSQEILNSYAEHLALGTSSDADDSVIEANLKSVEALLKATQKFGDQRTTRALKDKTKVEREDSNPSNDNNNNPDNAPEWFKAYMSQQAEKENKLREELNAIKGQQAQASFDDMVAKVGKELHLEGDLLDLAKAKLSSDMDETSVRTSLGAVKEIFVKNGAIRVDDGSHYVSTETAMQEEEKAWIEDKIKQQQV